MASELLYDIGQQAFQDGPWLLAAGTGVLVAVLAWWRQRRRGQPAGVQAFFIAFAGAALLGVTLTAWDHARLVGHLQAGRVLVAEGPVLAHALQDTARWNHSSKRYDRSTWESFHVGSTAFVYRRGGGVGFHNGGDTPVAIHDGQQLRVHYVEDVDGDRSQRRIVRLERLCAAACKAGARPA